MSESIKRSETSVVALVLQSIAVVAGVAVLALSPPASGPVLVVPLGSASPLIWLGRSDDVRIVGLGRLAGSIMVLGERDRLLPVALRHGAILLPALPDLCEQRR
ncbi:MAG: hypothetical protein KAY22_07940 [Rhizorhabdus sp.]|uniref:hypothetical protein n=1 Tax=Rhizorhabdus sp. TaxID=1968843 RepID=UPI001B598B5B|nr:hypothetical protein [Rhizorhabdus sp.]MBP8232218.1 hypothetical protein [Rhizorhabdus sp.]